MIGKTVSHYKILSELGRGGMGVVYKALDTTLDRHVAVKVLASHLSLDEEATKRFTYEAKTASALNHPNIGVVHEIGRTEEGETFMVMAYYEGESLQERIDRGGMSAEEALGVAAQVASGLSKAHGRGIVHRDIKPSNVLLTEDGHAVIIDFGLAKLVGRTRLTREGMTLGTAAYMSPEQARGEEVDHRSDIFSLGVMLYEMLVGEKPFRGDYEAALLYEIVHEEPRPLGNYGRELPAGTQQVVAHALAKDRGERYGDAAQLLKDLRKLQKGEEVSTLVREGLRKGRRNWILTTVAIGIVSIIAVYAVLNRFVLTRPGGPAGPGEISALPAIAVFPFTVRGSEANNDLHEGMVDLLSMKLNGAGRLRSVDPQVLLSAVKRGVQGSLDLPQASKIAGRLGAVFYLMGDVFGVGEQLVINASLYDLERGTEAVIRTSVEGTSNQILELIDSLAIRLVKDRLGDLLETPVALGDLTTQSYPAIKAFLEGEREFRAGRPFMPGGQKSVAAYQRAVEADSTFALAWLRLANVSAWWGGDMFERALKNAVRFSLRLSERDRLYAQAYCTMWSIVDFCNPQEFFPGESQESTGRAAGEPHIEIEKAERLYRTVLASWPDDFEAWMGMGWLHLYHNWRRGRSMSEAREAFEHARELDPDSWRVLWRLYWISSHERKFEEVERLLRKVYPDSTGMTIQETICISYGLGREDEKRAIYEELKSASVWEVFTSSLNVSQGTDDIQGAQEIAQLLIEPEHPEEIRGLGHALLAHQEAARGRWGAAKQELSRAMELNATYTIEYRALLAAMPFLGVPETDIEAYRQDLNAWNATAVTPGAIRLPWLRMHDDIHPVLRTYLLGLCSARLGETDAALERAVELEGMFDVPESPRDSTWIQDIAHGLRAQAALAEGRPEDALAHFEKARFKVMHGQVLFSSFYFQTLERYLRAEVLFELGRYEEALGWYGSFGWCWGYEFVYLAPAHLRRAQIYERMGQPEKAIEHCAMFVRLWADCDNHLRPLVREAEQKLESLRRAASDI